tara:strand:- start:19124 stop:19459 length:336 start_codon:yes stop_codon:yes gene_type:complete
VATRENKVIGDTVFTFEDEIRKKILKEQHERVVAYQEAILGMSESRKAANTELWASIDEVLEEHGVVLDKDNFEYMFNPETGAVYISGNRGKSWHDTLYGAHQRDLEEGKY